MNNNHQVYKINPPPLLTLPKIPKQEVRYICPKKAKFYEYHIISNGCKKVFTDKDALSSYSNQRILPPNKVSYINLFINAVLQPKENYTIEEGKIILYTKDIPLAGTPITLQMIKIE